MRLGAVKSTDHRILVVLCVVVLTASTQLAAHTVAWQKGKLIKSEPLFPSRTNTSKPPCFLLLVNAIHTVETEDFTYKFVGISIDFALVPDTNKFKFRIGKDGRVSVQDKRGHEQQTSLRIYAQTNKINQAVATLSPKAKHRDWHVANVTRMQPILYSFDTPWFLSTPEPPCPLSVVFIRGWAYELDADGIAYEVVQKGSELPAITVSSAVRIAEKGKNEAFILDQTGKERKFRLFKKTIQNRLEP